MFSDKAMVEEYGILNCILPGHEIMADRAFTITDFLFPFKVKLNIPAITKSKYQHSEEDVTETRRVVTVSIHVEKKGLFDVLRCSAYTCTNSGSFSNLREETQ